MSGITQIHSVVAGVNVYDETDGKARVRLKKNEEGSPVFEILIKDLLVFYPKNVGRKYTCKAVSAAGSMEFRGSKTFTLSINDGCICIKQDIQEFRVENKDPLMDGEIPFGYKGYSYLPNIEAAKKSAVSASKIQNISDKNTFFNRHGIVVTGTVDKKRAIYWYKPGAAEYQNPDDFLNFEEVVEGAYINGELAENLIIKTEAHALAKLSAFKVNGLRPLSALFNVKYGLAVFGSLHPPTPTFRSSIEIYEEELVQKMMTVESVVYWLKQENADFIKVEVVDRSDEIDLIATAENFCFEDYPLVGAMLNKEEAIKLPFDVIQRQTSLKKFGSLVS